MWAGLLGLFPPSCAETTSLRSRDQLYSNVDLHWLLPRAGHFEALNGRKGHGILSYCGQLDQCQKETGSLRHATSNREVASELSIDSWLGGWSQLRSGLPSHWMTVDGPLGAWMMDDGMMNPVC